MKEKQRVFKITQEITDLFTEAKAMRVLRDKYIGSAWFEGRSVKYAKEYERLVAEAWVKVHELYPDIHRDLSLNWNAGNANEVFAKD